MKPRRTDIAAWIDQTVPLIKHPPIEAQRDQTDLDDPIRAVHPGRLRVDHHDPLTLPSKPQQRRRRGSCSFDNFGPLGNNLRVATENPPYPPHRRHRSLRDSAAPRTGTVGNTTGAPKGASNRWSAGVRRFQRVSLRPFGLWTSADEAASTIETASTSVRRA
jgi:hypothetical protein